MFKVTLWGTNWTVKEYRVSDLQEAAELVHEHTRSKKAVEMVLELKDPKIWATSVSEGNYGGWRVSREG